jgi:hypothetical protein
MGTGTKIQHWEEVTELLNRYECCICVTLIHIRAA